ncbi:MAG: DUF2971 domain-containing protein [Methylococcales bacterium]
MTEQDEIWALFNALYTDIQNADIIFERKPLLAHYTSIQTIEKIIKDEEIWFSNPLCMNDTEELRFGLNTGMRLFTQSNVVDEIIGKQKADDARQKLTDCYMEYNKTHAIKVYVFCLSEHRPDDNDGKLSMWRAYGSGGNGAAIVFNTEPIFKWEDSPLIIAKVDYATREERKKKLGQLIQKWCSIVADNHIAEDKFWIAPASLFNAFTLFALTWKHSGFKEEQEWRVIYMPERDRKGILKDKMSYVIGSRGVEPKLKLNIAPLPGSPSPSPISLASLLDRIILGPCVSSDLAISSFHVMLNQIKPEFPEFVDKVFASTIPLRPTQG